KEALEQQTATSEILRVISRSPTDVQPVFDTIAHSAARLCNGLFGTVYRFDGHLIHLVGHYQLTSEALEEFRRVYPIAPSPESVVAQAIVERSLIHISDVEGDPSVPPMPLQVARAAGYRALLLVPMLQHGRSVGAIGVARRESHPFSDK